MKTMTLAPLAAGLLLAFNAAAQDHSQHQMPAATPQDHSQHQMPAATPQDHSQHRMPAPAAQDHSQHQAKPKTKPKPMQASGPKASPEPAAKPVDHAAMGHDMPPEEPGPPVDHSAMGHGTPSRTPAEPVEHAARGRDTPPEEPTPPVDPSATGQGTPSPTPAEPVDHAAMGHDMPPEEPTPSADHSAMGHGAPPPTPAEPVDHAAMGHAMPRPHDQPITPIPVLTDADRAAAAPPPNDHPVHDDTLQSFVLIDRLEGFDADEGRGMEWEAQAWIGTDLHTRWLRSEGERVTGNLEDADLEVLYGRSIARWWDVVAGLRHHFEPGDAQDMAVLGVMGVAPYKFEVEASLYVGDSGYTGARLELEYETLLTNRWILQPAIEVNIHGQDDRSHGNGAGLGTVEAGLRLRYEFTRQFAPYIGIVHERAYGRTAEFRLDDGENINDTRFVAGLRIWF